MSSCICDPANCCVLGFHTAFDASTPGHPAVQTFAWASWASEGIFSSFSDVTHSAMNLGVAERSFVNNLRRHGSFQMARVRGNLETGDPIKCSRTRPFGNHQRFHLPSADGSLAPVVYPETIRAFKALIAIPHQLLTGVAQDCSAE